MDRILLIGLGNPGERYRDTRHNLGAAVLRGWEPPSETLMGASMLWRDISAAGGEAARFAPARAAFGEVVLVCPRIVMNRSGEAAQRALAYFKLTPQELLVLHDEIELPLGAVRPKAGGSAAGHNGVRSLQRALGTDQFFRLRLGIGRPHDNTPVSEYVLQPFLPNEAGARAALIQEAHAWLTKFITIGAAAAGLVSGVSTQDN